VQCVWAAADGLDDVSEKGNQQVLDLAGNVLGAMVENRMDPRCL
jgi:hypothetical protein